MGESTIDGFGNTDFLIVPQKPYPSISEDIQQTLSRLLLWDSVNKIWRGARVSPDGQLQVTFAGAAINAVTYGQVLVPVAAGLLFAANPYRRQLLIQVTAREVFLGFDNTVNSSKCIRLGAGCVFSIDNYIGEVWGLTATVATNSNYIEV